MKQENCEVNLGVERTLTDSKKYLWRATDEDFFFFFLNSIPLLRRTLQREMLVYLQ